MREETVRAAIRASHATLPKVFLLESNAQKSLQGSADYLNWIVKTLVDCYDRKRRPKPSLLYALGSLADVANLVQEAANGFYPVSTDS